MSGPVVGRAADEAWLRLVLGRCADGGVSALLTGDAGIGKSVLLDAAARDAAEHGMVVLRAEGVEFESDLTYATLNQLLHPALAELPELDPGLRDGLAIALGLRSGDPPAPLTVATATLRLMARAGGGRPVLAVIDDVQWADPPSATVLSLVARRTTGTRVGLLLAARSEHPTLLARAVTTTRTVGPLPAAAARDLLDARHPGLTVFVRERLLADAAGNPLALLELGAAIATGDRSAAADEETVPLSERLRLLFADRVDTLPPVTRDVLLAAALEPACTLSDLQGISRGTDVRAELQLAVDLRLVAPDGADAIRFTHPLTRSAVVTLAPPAARERCHRRLAVALGRDPARRAWHLGRATSGPDDEVAAALDEAAPEIFRRGDARGAVVAMTRAADLSTTPESQARRLATAAWYGACMAGDAAYADVLLARAHEADPSVDTTLAAAAALPYLALNGHGDVDAVNGVLGRIYETTDFSEAPPALLHEVFAAHDTLASLTRRGDIFDDAGAALRRLGPRARVADVLLNTFNRGPVIPKVRMLPTLEAEIADLDTSDDLRHIVIVCVSALITDRGGGCRAALGRVVARCGSDRTNVLLILALQLLAEEAVTTGRWTDADRLIDQARATASTDTFVSWILDSTAAELAAHQGRSDEVHRLCTRLAECQTPLRARVVQLRHDTALAYDASARADWPRAYALLRSLMPSHDPIGELSWTPHMTLEFCEAAWHSGRILEAREHAAAMRAARCAELSPRIALLVAGAEALVAHRGADILFERALALPDAGSWPWDRARVQLAHGRRLRADGERQRARGPLEAAATTFEQLGAAPWLTQTVAELRLCGSARSDAQPTSLTAQETRIADLAAGGLTNKQIAEKLGLSPRTVGAHLYRIFPKLGVTTRAALRDALRPR